MGLNGNTLDPEFWQTRANGNCNPNLFFSGHVRQLSIEITRLGHWDSFVISSPRRMMHLDSDDVFSVIVGRHGPCLCSLCFFFLLGLVADDRQGVDDETIALGNIIIFLLPGSRTIK